MFLLTCTAYAQTPQIDSLATSTIVLADYSTSSIKAYIEAVALKEGVSVDLALYVAKHESEYHYYEVGDEGIICKKPTSPFFGRPVYARGIYQFTRCYWYNMTDAQAFDPIFNIKTAMPLLKDKEICLKQFTTCRWYYNGRP